MKCECSACGSTFGGFSKPISFRDPDPTLPDKPGVYVVRVKRRGLALDRVLRKSRIAADKLQESWPMAGQQLGEHVKRLKRIGDCPVLYIGLAGRNPTSSNTIRDRYEQLCWGHVAQIPLSVLALFGWHMEIRYMTCSRTRTREKERKLIEEYKQRHHGRRPAFNER